MKHYFTFIQMWCLLCMIALTSTQLQAQDAFWNETKEGSFTPQGKREIVPQRFKLFALDFQKIRESWENAPKGESFNASTSNFIVRIPTPNGTMENFRLVRTQLLSPSTQASSGMQDVRTFTAQGIEDPTATLTASFTIFGFHGMVQSVKGLYYIDPYSTPDTRYYMVYFRSDYISKERAMQTKAGCQVKDETPDKHDDHEKPEIDIKNLPEPKNKNGEVSARPSGTQQRKYIIAYASTLNYTNFHGNRVGATTDPNRIIAAKNAITVTTNRIKGIYEKEVAVSFELLLNDLAISTNSNTNNFSNSTPGTLINQSQTIIDQVYGNSAYQIGHTVSTGGGGLAGLGVVCNDGSKARGITGSPQPINDAYDVDFVAHEVGHQFNCPHTFNGQTDNCQGTTRVASSAYEPGSGTTIMAYAGICGADDVQLQSQVFGGVNNGASDPFFHTRSFDNILTLTVDGVANACAANTNTGNGVPVITMPAGGWVIPISTPFALTASATDPNGHPMTYSWEQFDLGPASTLAAANPASPLFRSLPPTVSPTRTFPRLTDLINNTTMLAETLPTTSRALNFRCTVRDNQPIGGVEYGLVTFSATSSAGPFVVTVPNTNLTWAGGSTQTVTWNVAGTTGNGVNCANVKISLSTDGGLTYPTVILASTPNDGTQSITVPNSATTTARIKVEAVDNIFFDISDNNFTITASAPDYTLTSTGTTQNACAPANAVFPLTLTYASGFNSQITLSASGLPTGAVGTFSPASPITPSGASTTVNFTISNTNAVASGTYNITINATGGTVSAKTLGLTLSVTNGTLNSPTLLLPTNNNLNVSIVPAIDWADVSGATTYDLQIATDAGFTANLQSFNNLAVSNYTPTTALNSNTTYFWRLRAKSACLTSNYSNAFSFKTANALCRTFTGGTTGNITDNNTTNFVLNIGENNVISSLELRNLRGTHANFNDLLVRLISPSNRTVVLWDGLCTGNQPFNLSIADAAATAINCASLNTNTSFKPANVLSAFSGDMIEGNWTLQIQDKTANNTGNISNWELYMCLDGSNTPPTADNNTINTNEDVNYTFTTGNFTQYFNDVDGQSLSKVRITNISTPTGATLEFNGTIITTSTVINFADLTKLVFKPAPNMFGSNYARFNYDVSDGFAYSTSSYLMVINVSPINDIPVIINNNGISTFPQSVTYYVIDNSLLSATDTEDTPLGIPVTYVLGASPTQGKLLKNNTTLAVGNTFTQNDINSLAIKFVPNDFSAEITDSFQFVARDKDGGQTTTQTFNIKISNSFGGDITVLPYPNPSSEVFYVKIDLPSTSKIEFEVFDAAGKQIKNVNVQRDFYIPSGGVNNNDYQISLKNEARGIYFLRIKIGNKNFTRRLVKS